MSGYLPPSVPEWRILPATPSDVGFLTSVVIEATTAQGRLPEGFEEAEWRERYVAWTRAQVGGGVHESTTSVIELGDEAVGRLRVVRRLQHIELSGIQLRPSAQCHGIGTGVIEQLKSEAAATGLPLELSVERDNPRARMLYERLGFVKIAESADEERFRWQPSGSTTKTR